MADIEKIQPIGDTEQYTLRARTDSNGDVIKDSYLHLSGGTMTGTINLAETNGLKTYSAAGYTTDNCGNFKHQSDVATNYWHLDSNAGTANFSVYWETGNVTAKGTVTAPTFSGALNGNASTATTLQTARTINGTSFNGSANITTANWGAARTLTIGNTGKSVNGSGNISWSLGEIGAAAASHSHAYLPMTIVTSSINFDDYKTDGIYFIRTGGNTNYATTEGNHGVLFVCFSIGTPFQLFLGDSSINYFRKRYYSGGWQPWFTMGAAWS